MRVRYTPRALSDLKRIYSYLHARSPHGAASVRAAVRNSVASLSDVVRGQETDRTGVLRLPVVRYQYAIYFRVGTTSIEIIHIRHTSRALPKEDDL